jgi:hypothetical protein
MEALAVSLQPGEWAELATNGLEAALENPGGSSHTILAYSDGGAWNPSTQQFFYIGGDHMGGPQRFIGYDAETNTWTTKPHPAWMPTSDNPNHTYDYQAIDVARSHYYFATHRYDIHSQTWDDVTKNGLPDFGRAHFAQDYFPGLGLVVSGDGGLYLLEDGAASWETLSPAGSLSFAGLHSISEYNPTHNILVFGGGDNSNQLYKLDAFRNITQLKPAPFPIRIYDTVTTTDPVSGDYLVFNDESEFWRYDVTTDSWVQQSNSAPFFRDPRYPEHPAYAVIASPVRNYGVIMVARYNFERTKLLLYKHSASSLPPVDRVAPNAPSDARVE